MSQTGGTIQAEGGALLGAPHGHELERLRRLYVALGQINRASVRHHTREELFTRVCDVLIGHGGLLMAWIGWCNEATHELVVVASAGDTSGYLDRVEVYTDDRPEGHGPSGTAFREDRPYICNDLFSDPASVPWRGELERRGFGASAALPIHEGGRVRGTLSVYADRAGFFRDEEISLLVEAAADISFGLDYMAKEEARRQAEARVEQLVAIVDGADDAILSTSLDGTVTSWNPAAERVFGWSADEIVGHSIGAVIPPELADEARTILERIRGGARVAQLETLRVRKDGARLPVAITVSPIWGPAEAAGSARVVGGSMILRDITERRAAEAVAASEQRFASGLIEAMPGILYHYDETGRFLRWNRNFERVSGYTAAEIARMHPLDFYRPEDKPLIQQKIAAVFEHGEATVEAPLLAKDGTTTPYFFTGRRVMLDGAPCLVGVGVDIAERRRAEDALRGSEERYRTTLDTILEGCQLLDFELRYLYLNPAAALQNRRPNDELLGRTMPEAWPGIEATEVFALLSRSLEERVFVRDEVAFSFSDGSSGWFDVRVQPVPEGIFVLSMDITERKLAERALRELNESLERKVAERTRDLDAARARAEAADRVKSAFLATMSHELRTPLNSVLGFTGIVLKGMAGPLTDEQVRQLGMVHGSARHLLDLINDVLDISKIEAGQLETRCAPFELGAAIDHVVASVRPMADKKGLALHVERRGLDAPIESDRRRVEQILLNLLNNAIKFTERGAVTLTADVVDEPDPSGAPNVRRRARIRVADTGIGMRPEDIAVAFLPFRQLDAGLQRRHEGTGLGLAICERLASLLGGCIHVESAWGHGSVFTVVLPLSPSDPALAR